MLLPDASRPEQCAADSTVKPAAIELAPVLLMIRSALKAERNNKESINYGIWRKCQCWHIHQMAVSKIKIKCEIIPIWGKCQY
jgi:hypothetical protein